MSEAQTIVKNKIKLCKQRRHPQVSIVVVTLEKILKELETKPEPVVIEASDPAEE